MYSQQHIVGGLLQLILDNCDQDSPPLKPVYSDCIVVYPRILINVVELSIE